MSYRCGTSELWTRTKALSVESRGPLTDGDALPAVAARRIEAAWDPFQAPARVDGGPFTGMLPTGMLPALWAEP